MGELSDALQRAESRRDPGFDPPNASAEVDVPPPSPISRSKEGSWKARAVLVGPPGPQVDQFRRFALRLRRSLEERGARSVLITSALEGEGKTLVASNLALALASMPGESRTALVDLDLHHPSVATAMGVAPGAGIETVLSGERNLDAARVRTDLESLDLFPAARSVPRPHEVLSRPELRLMLDELSRQYTIVICDSPPVLLAPDVQLITPHVGACVLVARSGLTRRLPLREMITMLPREKLIGTFLNCASLPRHARNYSGYSGYSRYAGEADENEGEESGTGQPDE